MRFTVQISVTDDDGQTIVHEDIAVLEKDSASFEDIGLDLSESKLVLRSLQEKMVHHQVKKHSQQNCQCDKCQKRYKVKGSYTLKYQTLFGDIDIKGPRFHRCGCEKKKKCESSTFSPLKTLFKEHVSAERLYLETKWASLFPYGKTVDLFKDVFPIDEKLNAGSIRNHLLKVAEKTGAELGEEQYMFIEGCERDWAFCAHMGQMSPRISFST
jgi:hypothetical protein